MSKATVTNAVITRNAATAMGTFVTCATGEGAVVSAASDDQKICIHVKNQITNATNTAVIEAGNGLQGVSDLEITLAASTENVVVVESGAYKQISGTDKGKIIVSDKSTTNTNAIAVAAVVLP